MIGVVPIPVWAVIAGLLGLAIGSFLNVVIYRVPAGESIVSPPSKCPRCGNQIRNRHNVPVLGWLILRGRCADCGLPISPRYPLVEAATGVLFAGVTALLLGAGLAAAIPAYLVCVAATITLGLVVADGHPAPRSLVAPAAVALAVLLIVAALALAQPARLVWAVGALLLVAGAALAAGTVPVIARAAPVAIMLAAAIGWLV
jgi:leader peptidase (prepilin peptidase)/N-methyltransferase